MRAKLEKAGIPEEHHDQALLRMGAGRYGKFAETYQLPPGVDVDNIKATYQGGVLRAIIPVPDQPIHPTQKQPFPFFSDNDLWW